MSIVDTTAKIICNLARGKYITVSFRDFFPLSYHAVLYTHFERATFTAAQAILNTQALRESRTPEQHPHPQHSTLCHQGRTRRTKTRPRFLEKQEISSTAKATVLLDSTPVVEIWNSDFSRSEKSDQRASHTAGKEKSLVSGKMLLALPTGGSQPRGQKRGAEDERSSSQRPEKRARVEPSPPAPAPAPALAFEREHSPHARLFAEVGSASQVETFSDLDSLLDVVAAQMAAVPVDPLLESVDSHPADGEDGLSKEELAFLFGEDDDASLATSIPDMDAVVMQLAAQSAAAAEDPASERVGSPLADGEDANALPVASDEDWAAALNESLADDEDDSNSPADSAVEDDELAAALAEALADGEDDDGGDVEITAVNSVPIDLDPPAVPISGRKTKTPVSQRKRAARQEKAASEAAQKEGVRPTCTGPLSHATALGSELTRETWQRGMFRPPGRTGNPFLSRKGKMVLDLTGDAPEAEATQASQVHKATGTAPEAEAVQASQGHEIAVAAAVSAGPSRTQPSSSAPVPQRALASDEIEDVSFTMTVAEHAAFIAERARPKTPAPAELTAEGIEFARYRAELEEVQTRRLVAQAQASQVPQKPAGPAVSAAPIEASASTSRPELDPQKRMAEYIAQGLSTAEALEKAQADAMATMSDEESLCARSKAYRKTKKNRENMRRYRAQKK